MPIIHWILSIILGITLIQNELSFYLIILSILSFIFAWFFAVGINDYYDIEIDRITNPTRPLITRKLVKKDVQIFFIVSGVLSFTIAILCDILNAKIGMVILTGIYLLLGILYSMPPIRIKSKTPFATIVIGIVTSECILVGGVLTELNILSLIYSVLLGFIVLFISAAKDFKDIEGDKAAGIPTIPVNYGPKKAALIFQIINTIGYGALLILFFFQPLSWFFGIIIISIIIVNLILFQRFKRMPGEKFGEIIYKIGFSLYLLCTIFLIVNNLCVI